jgi:hypothetical protein
MPAPGKISKMKSSAEVKIERPGERTATKTAAQRIP